MGPCDSVEHEFGIEHLRASIFKRDLTVTVINILFCSDFEIISYAGVFAKNEQDYADLLRLRYVVSLSS